MGTHKDVILTKVNANYGSMSNHEKKEHEEFTNSILEAIGVRTRIFLHNDLFFTCKIKSSTKRAGLRAERNADNITDMIKEQHCKDSGQDGSPQANQKDTILEESCSESFYQPNLKETSLVESSRGNDSKTF